MITSKGEIALLNISTKIQRNRSYSTALCGQCLLPDKPSIIKEIANNLTHSWEYNDSSNQPDPTGPLTKSSLIYRLKCVQHLKPIWLNQQQQIKRNLIIRSYFASITT